MCIAAIGWLCVPVVRQHGSDSLAARMQLPLARMQLQDAAHTAFGPMVDALPFTDLCSATGIMLSCNTTTPEPRAT